MIIQILFLVVSQCRPEGLIQLRMSQGNKMPFRQGCKRYDLSGCGVMRR